MVYNGILMETIRILIVSIGLLLFFYAGYISTNSLRALEDY